MGLAQLSGNYLDLNMVSVSRGKTLGSGSLQALKGHIISFPRMPKPLISRLKMSLLLTHQHAGPDPLWGTGMPFSATVTAVKHSGCNLAECLVSLAYHLCQSVWDGFQTSTAKHVLPLKG